MYMIPQLHECPKCGNKFNWSVHHDVLGLRNPFCPECYIKFISNNVPLGENIQ